MIRNTPVVTMVHAMYSQYFISIEHFQYTFGIECFRTLILNPQISYENGIGRQTSYIILTVVHLLTLVSTFLFLPKDFIKKPDTPKHPNADVAYDKESGVELTGG